MVAPGVDVDPAGHWVQLLAPATGANVPAGHAAQKADPGPFAYVPGLHAVQDVAVPPVENDPAPHGKQLPLLKNRPALQAVAIVQFGPVKPLKQAQVPSNRATPLPLQVVELLNWQADPAKPGLQEQKPFPEMPALQLPRPLHTCPPLLGHGKQDGP